MRQGIRGRKIWTGMFLSYMLIILLCFGIYSSVLLAETYVTGKERAGREIELKTQEVANLIDTRLIKAQGIVTNINSSTAIGQLYRSILSGSSLDSNDLLNIIKEVKALRTTTSLLDLEDVVILVDGYKRAYSSTGVVALSSAFERLPTQGTFAAVDSLSGLFGFDGQGKLTLITEGFLYVDDYKGSGSTGRGSVVVRFNMQVLANEIEKALGDEVPFNVWFREELLYTAGEPEGEAVRIVSGMNESLYVEAFFEAEALPPDSVRLLWIIILASLGLTLVFIFMAWYFANKYYKPIGRIKQMVSTAPQSGTDEMAEILEGIQSLIGERNGYRERMLTIAPYAQQGMLHGVLTGNVEHETVKVLSSKSYLDLQKPFFTISALNFAWKKPEEAKEAKTQLVLDICARMCSIFSNEERKLYTFNKSAYDLFLIVNTDTDEGLDDLFFQVHKYITESLAGQRCLVTMGIDEMQDDIGELQDACLRAWAALEEMTISGRGEVYFYEPRPEDEKHDHWFPKQCDVKLIRAVKAGRLPDVRALLEEIYEKNISRPDITTAAVHALADELHVTALKVAKECTELKTTQVRVEKIDAMSTLREIFDYYYAVFEALVTQVPEAVGDGEGDKKLGSQILEYVEEHFCDPELSVQLLADKFGVSSKYISNLYRTEVGETYLQSLQGKRIAKAMELLREGVHTTEAVGELCGYTSPLTFRRNFKAVTGMTPSDFRSGKGS